MSHFSISLNKEPSSLKSSFALMRILLHFPSLYKEACFNFSFIQSGSSAVKIKIGQKIMKIWQKNYRGILTVVFSVL